MTSDVIELRHATDLDSVWTTLIEVYAEVRADRLHQPHYSVERYGERLARHGAEPGWEAVVAFDGTDPVGYAYANTLQPGDRWWQRMRSPLPDGCADKTTVALKEMLLRVPWRGTGVALRIHDELQTRKEEQVSLLVNPLSGGGKVKALYEKWGYKEVSTQQLFPDGPALTAMLRPVRMEPHSMTANALDLRHFTHEDLPKIRQTLIDVHADVHADRMGDDEFRQKFPWFVDHWGGNPGFSCVIAYDSESQPASHTAHRLSPAGSGGASICTRLLRRTARIPSPS